MIRPISSRTLSFVPHLGANIGRDALVLTAIVLAGLAIRLYHLSDRSLWFDEAFCWRLIQFPLLEMIPRVGQDNHPPLYFIVLKGWAAIFGESPLALRSLSVLFGILTILGVYLFAVEAFGNTFTDATEEMQARGRGIGLFAAALVALSAFQVRYSQEVRMYALAGVLAVFSSWALLRALRPPSRLHRWLLYSFLALLLAYTHYYALFTLASQAIFVIGFLFLRADWSWITLRQEARFWHAVLAAALVTISWLPWFPVFLRQRAQVQSAYWTPVVNRWSLVQTSYQLFVAPVQGNSMPTPRSQQLLVADLCVLGLWLLRRKARMGEWFVLSAAIVPLLLALVVSAYDTRIIGAPRFFLIVHLFLLIGLAALVWRLPSPERIFIVAALLAVFFFLYVDFWNTADITHKPGARGAAEYIDGHRRPGEPVIVSSPLFFFSALYHAKQRAGHYIYTEDKPIPHYHGKAALIPDDLLTAEQMRTLTNQRVWFVDMAGSTWFGWRTGSAPEGWKEKSRTIFPEAFGLGNVIVVEYEIPQQDQK